MDIDQNPKIAIPPEHKASFEAFTELCAQAGLLTRPESLESRDSCDGLSDPTTLVYVTIKNQISFRPCLLLTLSDGF